ncbi:MAG: GGDEF domain-containing protein [Acaryochloridaceae cyanobacterium RL_2_7]|nr:GGDEF domain-containing protein [Acaryochloridaceae cyanobacterium RL_2_7]
MAVILCDIDFFKQYNDTYGHPAGDTCLQKVAKAMNHSVRNLDLVGRYGGEEFMIILSNPKAEIVPDIAERLRAAVETLQIPHAKSQVNTVVTISGGVAYQAAATVWTKQAIIDQADAALYQAKRQGRNQMVLAEPEEHPMSVNNPAA